MYMVYMGNKMTLRRMLIRPSVRPREVFTNRIAPYFFKEGESLMGKLPYYHFYTGDWFKDPNLSMCSPATRGIWIDFLCAMHELDRSGQITATREQLARLGRCTTVELDHALSELETTSTANVTKRDDSFTLCNRRMQREHIERVRIKNAMKKSRCDENVTSVSSYSSSNTKKEESIKEEKASPPLSSLQAKAVIKKQLFFEPPDLVSLKSFFPLNNSSEEEAEKFMNYYESKGWVVGKSSMKNWQAAARNWIKNQKNWELEKGGNGKEHRVAKRRINTFSAGTN